MRLERSRRGNAIPEAVRTRADGTRCHRARGILLAEAVDWLLSANNRSNLTSRVCASAFHWPAELRSGARAFVSSEK